MVELRPNGTSQNFLEAISLLGVSTSVHCSVDSVQHQQQTHGHKVGKINSRLIAPPAGTPTGKRVKAHIRGRNRKQWLNTLSCIHCFVLRAHDEQAIQQNRAKGRRSSQRRSNLLIFTTRTLRQAHQYDIMRVFVAVPHSVLDGGQLLTRSWSIILLGQLTTEAKANTLPQLL